MLQAMTTIVMESASVRLLTQKMAVSLRHVNHALRPSSNATRRSPVVAVVRKTWSVTGPRTMSSWRIHQNPHFKVNLPSTGFARFSHRELVKLSRKVGQEMTDATRQNGSAEPPNG